MSHLHCPADASDNNLVLVSHQGNLARRGEQVALAQRHKDVQVSVPYSSLEWVYGTP